MLNRDVDAVVVPIDGRRSILDRQQAARDEGAVDRRPCRGLTDNDRAVEIDIGIINVHAAERCRPVAEDQIVVERRGAAVDDLQYPAAIFANGGGVHVERGTVYDRLAEASRIETNGE